MESKLFLTDMKINNEIRAEQAREGPNQSQ